MDNRSCLAGCSEVSLCIQRWILSQGARRTNLEAIGVGLGPKLRASRRGKSRGSGDGRFLAGCHEDVLNESLARRDGPTKTAAEDGVLSYDARGISNRLHRHDDVDGVLLPHTGGTRNC